MQVAISDAERTSGKGKNMVQERQGWDGYATERKRRELLKNSCG